VCVDPMFWWRQFLSIEVVRLLSSKYLRIDIDLIVQLMRRFEYRNWAQSDSRSRGVAVGPRDIIRRRAVLFSQKGRRPAGPIRASEI
jgi:hypothetical protein